MRMSDEQEFKLSVLRRVHEELALKRTTLRAQIEERLQDELNSVYLRRAQAASECLSAGISKTKIGRAMGTSDWKTITDILAQAQRGGSGQVSVEGRPWRLEGVDETGSPERVVLATYPDKATKETVEGPLTIHFKKIFGGPMVDLADPREADAVDLQFLYDLLQDINAPFLKPEPEPERQTEPDNYSARFFVPDDEDED